MSDDARIVNLVPKIAVPDDPRIDDLMFYREGVETLMQLRSGKPISNDQPDHAAILFELFFKYAENHVRILCRKLSNNVFGNPAVVDRAAWALKKNVRISVIIQDNEPDDNKFVELLRNSASGATILHAPENVKSSPVNFAVMDERAFRVEPNRDDCKAEAVMFGPLIAKQLARRFDQLVLRVTLTSDTLPAHAG